MQTIHEKHIQKLRDIRGDVKIWKCANMGYNNRGISIDEGLEINDDNAIKIYNMWTNILDKADSIFVNIINEENIKDGQIDKRRKELQKFFIDTIAKDILDGDICKFCEFKSKSKFFCYKDYE